MLPMKKIIRRQRVVLIAVGMVWAGSLVSPAVIPISSVPEKAKLTGSRVVKTTPKRSEERRGGKEGRSRW